MTTKPEDMATRIERAKKQIKGKGGDAIGGLEKIAVELGMASLATQLRNVAKHLQADTFKLIVVGRQKNGNSTLVNSTLGKITGRLPDWFREPMPTDELPATAILTRVQHSATPFVRAWNFDGGKDEWSLERYHREAVLRGTEKENRTAFEKIREFEVGYPAQLLESGVTYIDSPGTDEHPSRTAITTAAMAECDAAIVVYRHSPSPGEAEMAWVASNILEANVRVFTVINLFNREPDERLRTLIWDKLVRELQGGPEYAGQDFASRDIYFVNALSALHAKQPGKEELYEKSGMALFESRLTDFLLKDRYETHVSRFVNAAEKHSGDMTQQISQRRMALQADRRKLDDAARSIEPKLDGIRMKRDRLVRILDRFRRECTRDLSMGFEQMVNQLRQDLPPECKTHPIPCLQSFLGNIQAHFTKKKAIEEAAAICEKIVHARIEAWGKNPASKPGAQQLLDPVLRRMVEEVADEVVAIQTSFQELHFDLTGWRPSISATPKDETMNRVLGIAGGVLMGNISSAVGGAGGVNEMLAGVAGFLAAKVVIFTVGLTMPFAIPVLLILPLLASFIAGRVGLEGRIWDQVCGSADEQLRAMPAAVRPKVEAEATKAFTAIETAILQDVDAIIAQEQQNIQQVLDLNRQDQAEKDKSLRQLDQAERQIGERKSELKEVMTLVKQAK